MIEIKTWSAAEFRQMAARGRALLVGGVTGTVRAFTEFESQMQATARMMPVEVREPVTQVVCYRCNEYDCIQKHTEDDNGS